MHVRSPSLIDARFHHFAVPHTIVVFCSALVTASVLDITMVAVASSPAPREGNLLLEGTGTRVRNVRKDHFGSPRLNVRSRRRLDAPHTLRQWELRKVVDEVIQAHVGLPHPGVSAERVLGERSVLVALKRGGPQEHVSILVEGQPPIRRSLLARRCNLHDVDAGIVWVRNIGQHCVRVDDLGVPHRLRGIDTSTDLDREDDLPRIAGFPDGRGPWRTLHTCRRCAVGGAEGQSHREW